MPKVSLIRLRKRRRRSPNQAKRRNRKRFARGTLALGFLLVVSNLSILTSNARQPAPVVHPVVVVAAEEDVPGRALTDPNPDPYDDGTLLKCKDGSLVKEGKEGKHCGWTADLISSLAQRAPPAIFVPSPDAWGLLALGLALIGASFWLRRSRPDIAKS